MKNKNTRLLCFYITLLGTIALGIYHIKQGFLTASYSNIIITILFIVGSTGSLLAYFNKCYNAHVSHLKTCLLIPTFNECKETVKEMLDSISSQTQRPDIVCMVEDGSDIQNRCEGVFKEWAATYNGETYYELIENSGKRHAQAVAFRKYKDVDVYITVDSDTVLDKNAVRNGLMPFADEKIMSVAGMLSGHNDKSNLLTRIINISFTTAFTNGRACQSFMKNVLVSCGGLAFYRAAVVHNNIEHYLSQKYFGKKATYSDDRMLTHYANIMGDTVIQESSIGYTLLPENISHLVRQRVRWHRGFFVAGGWFIHNQSIKKPSWWIQMWQYVSFALCLPIMVVTLMTSPVHLITYLVALSYVRSLKVFTLAGDKHINVADYILFVPLATMLNMFIVTGLRVYALLTLNNSGWGTRSVVEVKSL